MGFGHDVGLFGSPTRLFTRLVPPPDILPHIHDYRISDGADNILWRQFPPWGYALLRIKTELSTFVLSI